MVDDVGEVPDPDGNTVLASVRALQGVQHENVVQVELELMEGHFKHNVRRASAGAWGRSLQRCSADKIAQTRERDLERAIRMTPHEQIDEPVWWAGGGYGTMLKRAVEMGDVPAIVAALLRGAV